MSPTWRPAARPHRAATPVGVIVPTLYNDIFANYLQALHNIFLISSFPVVVVNSRYSDNKKKEANPTLLGQHVDAIIILGVDHTPMARQHFIFLGLNGHDNGNPLSFEIPYRAFHVSKENPNVPYRKKRSHILLP